MLYDRVVEVDERVTLVDYTASPQGMNLPIPPAESGKNYKRGTTGEWVHILKTPDLESLKTELVSVYQSGIQSIAVCW